MKNIVSISRNITPSFDGLRWVNWPDGDKPSGYLSTPRFLDTDIVSGSLTGGENGKGAYLSLFGYSLGNRSSLGTSSGAQVWLRDPIGDNTWYEVDNYRVLKKSKVFPALQIQQIIVQVGSLGGGQVSGRALDIKITVNGIDAQYVTPTGTFQSYKPAGFTIQPGRFFFVDNVYGNDSTGVVDDITHPYRYLQYFSGASPSGIWADIKPGDTLVMRGRGSVWSDQTGVENKFMRFFQDSGVAPRGAIGNTHTNVLGMANNGSGLIRVQIASTAGMTTGSKVQIFGARSVSTETGANGLWTITVIDSTHIDLQGSSFGGAWASRGIVTNYSGYIHITAYPGPIFGNAVEDVHFQPAADQAGAIHGCSSYQAYLQCGRYWSVSNLHIENSGVTAAAPTDSGLINLQNGADGTRFVGNELGPYPVGPAVTGTRAGGIAGVGVDSTALFNYIHDIGGTSALENHGIYLGGEDNNGYQQCAQNVDIGYNWIKNITGGSSFQCNWANSLMADGKRFNNIRVHHNVLDGCAKYGINWGPSSLTGKAWNNIILNSGWAGFRIQPSTTTEASSIDLRNENNTLYNPNSTGRSSMGAIQLECNLSAGSCKFQHNILYVKANAQAFFTSYNGATADAGVVTFNRNVYFDESGTLTTSNAPGPSHTDSNKIYGNPLFTDAANGNFTLATGSPALNAATSTKIITEIADDAFGIARPQGAYNDIGACEGVGT